jgi:hypothetical protein
MLAKAPTRAQGRQPGEAVTPSDKAAAQRRLLRGVRRPRKLGSDRDRRGPRQALGEAAPGAVGSVQGAADFLYSDGRVGLRRDYRRLCSGPCASVAP